MMSMGGGYGTAIKKVAGKLGSGAGARAGASAASTTAPRLGGGSVGMLGGGPPRTTPGKAGPVHGDNPLARAVAGAKSRAAAPPPARKGGVGRKIGRY